MKPNIKEIISYKTKDGIIFEQKKNAIVHAKKLIEGKNFTNLVQQVTSLFKSSLDKYKKAEYSKDYKFYDEDNELELDFWSDNSADLSNIAANEILINDFKAYTKIIMTLMGEYHLEEIIKLIKNQNKIK